MIAAMVQATTDPAMREKLEQDMNQSSGGEWANSIAAHRRILDGERDEAALCEPLGYQEAAVIRAILEGIDGQE